MFFKEREMVKKVLLLVIVLGLALTGCTVNGFNINVPTKSIDGSGDVKTENREVAKFDRVDMQGIGNLTITSPLTLLMAPCKLG
jgi:hypothetical protein